jgi:hypothetical protein
MITGLLVTLTGIFIILLFAWAVGEIAYRFFGRLK